MAKKADPQRKKKDASLYKETERSVSYWQRKGFAPDWFITVEIVDNDHTGTLYTINWSDDYRNAKIFPNRKNLDIYNRDDAAARRRAVLHELLHIVSAPADDWVNKNFQGDSHFAIEYRARREMVVDTIATAVYRLVEGGKL